MASPPRPIRVLVVDDSAFARELVSSIVASDPDMVVAGQAADGFEAVTKAALLQPDIITMDIEMPLLGGIEAIERIMAAQPVPILVVTSHTGVRTAFAAVSKGALDVVEKPDIDTDNGAKLLKKIKLLASVDIRAHMKATGHSPGASTVTMRSPALESRPKRIIAIAASTGGPHALQVILASLPATLPVPILISQHVADGFAQGMAEWLNTATPLPVAVACKGEILAPGRVYLNPSEFHMRVTAQGMIILTQAPPGQTYHPSCDAMLLSVASAYGAQALGVILTGMGDDGVAGMQALKAAGGATMAQDQKSSIVFGMNGVAVSRGCIDSILPIQDIPGAILRQITGKAG